ncbi:HepT-like ribonuclease domain-containing protein [Demequina capsici]|uniref:DUF86 domain-containing protein n=1 Tax=Demequina capsici TaxID=3075620 RepID=A0AA96F3W6_9MICO|nr:HepT-like ribonuclease domain-containing protein [Demequina sp. OYTSA14]WNM23541.1 DUF86 domain-containing protein [Demequina sp. OYTSA14]
MATELEIDAICMRISSRLESLNRLPHEVRSELFGDSWPAMWGMRNRIAHTYTQVEPSVVIATLNMDLPEIRKQILNHLDQQCA